MKKAIFGGTFDPFTIGHRDVVKRAGQIFDKVYIAVAEDTGKSGVARLADRIRIITKSTEDLEFIEIVSFSGGMADFMRAMGINCLVRGVRNSEDYAYERDLLEVYKSQDSKIEGVYIFSAPRFLHISSTVVRELLKINGDIGSFVFCEAEETIKKVYRG